jgi:hypothetical protein
MFQRLKKGQQSEQGLAKPAVQELPQGPKSAPRT